jgi:hypothetical protein
MPISRLILSMFSFKAKQTNCPSFYLKTLLMLCSLLIASTITMNYWVDPYTIHQWDSASIRRYTSAPQKLTAWSKTYAAYRYQPEVVYLGSSRTEIGLPTDFPLFRGKRVLNLSLSGSSLGDAVNMLDHTSFFNRPEIIVWGLEFGLLFAQDYVNTDFEDSLVAVNSLYPLIRFLITLKRSLSIDMTVDSIRMLTGTDERVCPNILATYGQKSARSVEKSMENKGGTRGAFNNILERYPNSAPPDPTWALNELRTAIDRVCGQGGTLRFFIQPVHALDELLWINHWNELEEWKRALVKIIDKQKQRGCDIKLFDFSGFNEITTEEIPQKTGKDVMNYYWEQSHYKSDVGQLILEILFDQILSFAPDQFGIELTGATIESHLKMTRQARDRYCRSHPEETSNFFCPSNPIEAHSIP